MIWKPGSPVYRILQLNGNELKLRRLDDAWGREFIFWTTVKGAIDAGYIRVKKRV